MMYRWALSISPEPIGSPAAKAPWESNNVVRFEIEREQARTGASSSATLSASTYGRRVSSTPGYRLAFNQVFFSSSQAVFSALATTSAAAAR